MMSKTNAVDEQPLYNQLVARRDKLPITQRDFNVLSKIFSEESIFLGAVTPAPLGTTPPYYGPYEVRVVTKSSLFLQQSNALFNAGYNVWGIGSGGSDVLDGRWFQKQDWLTENLKNLKDGDPSPSA